MFPQVFCLWSRPPTHLLITIKGVFAAGVAAQIYFEKCPVDARALVPVVN